MPTDKDFKRLVRQRMTVTGERYTTARAALALPGEDDRRRLVALLADPDTGPAAYDRLAALPDGLRREAALSGLDADSWRVRRSCCRLLDDVETTPSVAAGLRPRLADEHPKVRRAALHTLTCQRCKPEGCTLDVRPVMEQMAGDPDRRVRETVLGALAWSFHDDWAVAMLERFAAADPSPRLRAAAADGLEAIADKRRSDRARRGLPDPVRAQSERHPGRWVAVVDGRVAAVAVSPRGARKALRGMGRPHDPVYFVAG